MHYRKNLTPNPLHLTKGRPQWRGAGGEIVVAPNLLSLDVY